MTQLKNSNSDEAVHREPLFASIWVALYCYFRNALDKDRAEGDSPADSPETEAEHTTH